MLIFIKILFGVYLLAINFYAFMIVKSRKEELTEACPTPSTSKFLIAALLGGAIGIYVSMFVNKYGLDSLIMMVFIPVIAAVNVFVVFMLFQKNFWFVV